MYESVVSGNAVHCTVRLEFNLSDDMAMQHPHLKKEHHSSVKPFKRQAVFL